MKGYIGVDGGASKTRGVLIDERGRILAEALTGPANVQLVSSEVLFERLQNLLDQLLASVAAKHSGPINLQGSCFGLAGASPPETVKNLKPMIASLTPVPEAGAFLTTDAAIALTAAFIDKPGILLIAGTGSICLGRDGSGSVFRTGGWGHLVDDCGSGGWIGRAALSAAFQQSDGRLAGNRLKTTLCDFFKVNAIEAFLPRLSDGSLQNCDFAELYPLVLQLAAKGDAPAKAILDQAVQDLLCLIETTRRKLGTEPVAVCLDGGVLHSPGPIQEGIRLGLAASGTEIALNPFPLTAADGAALAAFRFERGSPPPQFLAALRKSRHLRT